MGGLYSLRFICFVLFICIGHCIGDNDNANCKRAPKKMDRAWVTVQTVQHKVTAEDKLVLYGQTEACYKCELEHIVDIPTSANCTVQLPTMFLYKLEVRKETKSKSHKLWNETHDIVQHSDYILFINISENKTEFNFSVHKQASDPNIPIYVAMAIFFLLAVLWAAVSITGVASRPVQAVKDILVPSNAPSGLIEDINQPSGSNIQDEQTTVQDVVKRKERVKSLDAFRGLCLVIMMFVNYGGGGYWFFDHSYWDGLTVADLVFPWFTWIIGTSIAVAFKNVYTKGTTKLKLARKILKRTIILFFLGIVLESSNGSDSVDMSKIRIPGVLQRLAVSYGVVAFLQVFFARDYVDDPHRHKWFSPVRDIIPYWPEWLVMLGLVALHLILTFAIHVPGCPRGYLGPGGLANHGKYPNCTGGSAGYIDRKLFGENHIYHSPTCKEVYKTSVPYDPEGTLGTMTSIFMCFLGLQAGKILIFSNDWKSRTIRWSTWAIILGLLAGCLCRFSLHNGWIPVNKNLWSLTFVLTLSSMAFILFTAFYLTIDVFSIWSGAPFFFTGMNSILVYVCHILFNHYFPVSWQTHETHASLLALHLWGPVFWTTVAAVLYYKKIFIAI